MIKKSTKRPKSKYIQQLYDSLTADGWVVTSRGAPDFFCWKVGEDGQVGFICVEAVRKGTYRLRKHQKAVIDALAKAGVSCYRYNCDSGKYQRITFENP
jgi:hypothetical protein